jgi:uncharacterized protein (DUF924 family)
MDDPAGVLDFWTGEVGEDGWYAGGEALDALIRERYADLWQAAHDGALDHWIDGTAGTLAFCIVTDQFPRNIWRGTARAFATDPQALAAAQRAVAEGWDMGAPEPVRQFFYLPYEHAEDMAMQDRCIALMATRLPGTGAENLLHARAHAAVIRRFGRFPFRNAALGRVTTAEEADWLAAGGYMAEVARLKGEG